jgi:glycosyltransferase involved in cell wall biosynthesis
MKILHIIPSLSPVRGGPSNGTLDISHHLIKQGMDVTIVTTDDDGSSYLDVPLNKLVEHQGVPTIFFKKVGFSVNFIREFSFSIYLTYWLFKNIVHYDIVHVHALFSYPSTIAMLIARLKKVPYLIQPHGLLCRWSLTQSLLKKRVYFKLLERANLNHSKGIIVTMEQEKFEVSELKLKAPFFTVPYGINPPYVISNAREKIRSRLELEKDALIILFMARLHPKKGLEFLIPALSNLSNKKFTFILAGNGDSEYEASIKSLLKKTGIESKTISLGFVGGELKQQLLQGSDLFVLTSHSENFGVAVFEAWSSGIPTLLTPGVALSTLSEQHGFGFVPQLDVESITDALQEYLDDTHFAKEKGNHARNFILKNYSWNRIITDLIQIYQLSSEDSTIAQLTNK